eukprot:CAMPEP_0195511936 /NCGR_PEP_ID=MMETSP0794_2-20130614/4080_1 /TAXON_ID=515487 /ORGANISM="Stephanopyxis turris, Strain CCMP 815" /LENGTH=574 /DNA_ID=CAMNT_0040639627 /DNA_START=154 /DNA_END=1878 /DNA_ORIENTATION=+
MSTTLGIKKRAIFPNADRKDNSKRSKEISNDANEMQITTGMGLLCPDRIIDLTMLHHSHEETESEISIMMPSLLSSPVKEVLVINDETDYIESEEEESRMNLLADERKAAEKEKIKSSNPGKAWLFVNKVLECQRRLERSPKGNSMISTVAEDYMVFLAEKFLDCQDRFKKAGSPISVSLGYHYSNQSNMGSIKQDGLMTHADRNNRNMHTGFHGAAFGDGIYTTNNPFVFHKKYGDIGMIVAILKGKTERVKIQHSSNTNHSVLNTVIGNKCQGRYASLLSYSQDIDLNFFEDEIVLQESCQCFPLVQFQSDLLSTLDDHNHGNETLWAYEREMQRMLDEFFNEGSTTKLERIDPSAMHTQMSNTAGGNFYNRAKRSYQLYSPPPQNFLSVSQIPQTVSQPQTINNVLSPYSCQKNTTAGDFKNPVTNVMQLYPSPPNTAVAQHLVGSEYRPKTNMMKRIFDSFVTKKGSIGKANQPSSQKRFVISWQSDNDLPQRRQVIARIVAIVKKWDKYQVSSSDWRLQTFPKLVKEIEKNLYLSAKCLESYVDVSTLKHRLSQSDVNAPWFENSTGSL